MDNEQPRPPLNIPSATVPPDGNIFSDIVDTAPYEKSLKRARIYLFIIAAIQAGTGVYEYLTIDDKDVALIAAGIDVGIGVLFLGLALWSYKKPAMAFMTALISFLVIHIGLGIYEPSNLYKGIILKILVVVALVKAYKDAKEVEKIRESVGEEV